MNSVSMNYPGAGWDGHDRFFEARLGEKLFATETEQGSGRHLGRATGQKENRVMVRHKTHTFREHGPVSANESEIRGLWLW